MNTDTRYEYYGLIRHEIVPMLPRHSARIVEIGCGTGATLRFLKDNGYADWVGGMDLYKDEAGIAEKSLDYFKQGSVESGDYGIAPESIDVLLCLDVLEHLVDPWTTLARLSSLLKPAGVLVTSIPNVRNLKVTAPLMFLGRWTYSDSGLLDRTHLRFFTKESAIEMVCQAGFSIEQVSATGLAPGSKAAWANILTLGTLRHLFEFQYLIKAIK